MKRIPERANILYRYQDGEKATQLCQEYEISLTTFHKWRQVAGIPLVHGNTGLISHHRIIHDDALVVRLHKEYKDVKKVGEILGVKPPVVYGALARKGVKLSNGVGSHKHNAR